MTKNQSSIQRLFKRYLGGDVGPREEAELERHAQSDDFLAEAIEGIRAQPAADHADAIARMRSKLPQGNAAVRPLGWFRIAAAASVLLLVGASLLLLPRLLDSSVASVAMQEALIESTDEVTAPTASEAAALDAVAPTETAVATTLSSPAKSANQAAEPAARAKELPPPSSPKVRAAETAGGSVASAATAEREATKAKMKQQVNAAPVISPSIPVPTKSNISSSSSPAEDMVIVEEVAEARVLPLAPPTVTGQRFKETEILSAGLRKISGYVTDENDQPIAKANVTLPGQPLGESTNAEGYFELIADNTVRQINVIHSGYQSAEVMLPSGEKEVQVNLETIRPASEAEDDWQFQGAISTYYPNQTPSSAALSEGTIRELRTAIIANKPANLGVGKVRVSFSVQKDGLLTNFSLGGRSSEALQAYVRKYLQQNSRWELIRGEEPSRIYLVFNFE